MPTLSDANMSSMAQRRKKPITYGKSSRNPAFTPQSVGSFYDEADRTVKAEKNTLRRIKPLTRKPDLAKHSHSHQATGRDEFDVPVSDDEITHSFPKSTPTKRAVGTPLRKEQERHAQTPLRVQKEQKRKSLEDMPAHKRTRTSSPVSPDLTVSTCTSAPVRIPPSSIKKLPSPLSNSETVKADSNRRSRRNPAKDILLHHSPVKGMSAPARLDEMLSSVTPQENKIEGVEEDQDMIEADDLPTTPAPSQMRPGMLRRTTSTTPKQSHLWSQLFSSDPAGPEAELSTNRPARQNASNPHHRTGSSVSKNPTSDTGNGSMPRQARLLDRLKHTSQSGGDSDFDEDDDEIAISEEENVLGIDHASSGPRVTISDNTQIFAPRESQSNHAESQNSTGPPASSSKTTYARTRSYLEEDTLEANLMLSMPTTTASTFRAPAFARRSEARPPVNGKLAPTFELDDDSDDGANGGIRSIHELRAAGSKKRFLDDNAAIFDDIKDHQLVSRSRRRSALMELATKLFDKAFLTRFVEHGFDRELSAEFTAPYPDPIYDATLCIVLAHIAELDVGEKSLTVLYQAGALEVPSRCLNQSKSMTKVARDRRNNMAKVAQSTFLDFVESIRTSSLWGDQQPEDLTMQLLGLKCMEVMVLRLRRQGNKGGILSREVVAELVKLAIGANDSSAIDTSTISPRAITQRLALSILEFASTSDALSTTWSTELWADFVSALPAMLRSPDESQGLALKLCINMTNNNVSNCDICAQNQTIEVLFHQIAEGFRCLHEESDEQDHVYQYDSLILALGLMINLAEFSDAAREGTVGLQSDGLAVLADIFLRGQERIEEAQSEEETQSNVAYGFLAVLLGNVCQDGRARDEVRACLPGKTLHALVAAIDEFAQYNMKVDSQTFEGEEGRDVWEHFTGRLMAVVTRLQELP